MASTVRLTVLLFWFLWIGRLISIIDRLKKQISVVRVITIVGQQAIRCLFLVPFKSLLNRTATFNHDCYTTSITYSISLENRISNKFM